MNNQGFYSPNVDERSLSLLHFAEAITRLTTVFAALNDIGKDTSGIGQQDFDSFVAIFMQRLEVEMLPWAKESKLAVKH